jgi:hypothetical protein
VDAEGEIAIAREENASKVFESRMFNGAFGYKEKEFIDGLEKLHVRSSIIKSRSNRNMQHAWEHEKYIQAFTLKFQMKEITWSS